MSFNIGSYVAARLVEIGVSHFFAVPGDFNLTLLDKLIENEKLQLISCCNELNAGYAADGYARAKGVAVVVVTFTVGSLSLINAIAGAYSDDLPVIVISGGLNSNDCGTNRIIHHTTGLSNKTQSFEIFKQVTCATELVYHPSDAPAQIDRVIAAALNQSKPGYIELSCNIIEQSAPKPIPYFLHPIPLSNPTSLESAVNDAVSFLGEAAKVVLVLGSKARVSKAVDAFLKLAEAIGCAVAVMPDAKGLFPENHPSFIGTYWGEISSEYCSETVESSNAYLFAGPVFNDYTTVGYSALIQKSKMIEVIPGRVKLPHAEYGCVYMAEFLNALAEKVKPNNSTLTIYNRMFRPFAPLPDVTEETILTTTRLFHHIQNTLTKESAVIAETGDSWFNGQKLRLPPKAKYEVQMQYGSIGWSVGATLGYSLGAGKKIRVFALIGDGSFQLTAQEVSTMIRYQVNPIIILINNRGYTIETEIHDGIYNTIKNWNYAQLINVFNADEGKGLGIKVQTEGELRRALSTALSHQDGPVLIECIIDKDDCSKELLEWGSRVSTANARPPKTAENF